jgi:catechol 2,3-dioxygenase-like lactoylglutathione lyase family enzyme
MVAITGMFSGIAVRDLDAAKKFYGETLGLPIGENPMHALNLSLPQGGIVFVYPKGDHEPATYTVLNLEVADIDAAVDELTANGVEFTRYAEMPWQDDKGIARGKSANMGPDIAWFTDPSGNILSVLSN